MNKLLKNELIKIFSQKKIYVFFAILAIMIIIEGLSSHFDEGSVQQISVNVYVLNTLANNMQIILPLFLSILIGDIIINEYISGTIKLPLIHSVSRKELFISKVLTLVIISLILFTFTFILSYLLGLLLLPWESTLEIANYSFSGFTAVFFVLISYFFTIISLISFMMPIVMLAMIFESANAIVASTVGLFIFFQILIQILSVPVRPFLIYFYFNIPLVLENLTSFQDYLLGLMVILGYIIIPYFTALRYFEKKDILY